MTNKNKDSPFELPESFLNQLNEFTNGFILVTLNDKREPDIYQQFHSVFDYQGMINFLEIYTGQEQEKLRSEGIMDEEDGEEGEEV